MASYCADKIVSLYDADASIDTQYKRQGLLFRRHGYILTEYELDGTQHGRLVQGPDETGSDKLYKSYICARRRARAVEAQHFSHCGVSFCSAPPLCPATPSLRLLCAVRIPYVTPISGLPAFRLRPNYSR